MTNMHFPVMECVPELSKALATSQCAILVAPPGAGKTTQVPLAMLAAHWLGDKTILMLEPRRLAARSAAGFMASQLGEAVGQTVGYSVRMDRKLSRHTRIEVVTEGILTRRLQNDPELANIGLVILDEFHERNLHSDLGLALLRDIQQGLRHDLRLLLMSATLEVAKLRSYFAHAPEIVSEGRQYQVTQHYLDRNPDVADMPGVLGQTVTTALANNDGDVLVFFPGIAEIERAREQLQAQFKSEAIDILPLHGSLSLSEQDRVMQPAASGHRKIILATNIAETSLTIDGLKVVIDTGYAREARFRADSGMTQLQTIRVTADSATQRCGRAGRQGPGQCYRLWSRHTQAGLVPERIPEILRADLLSLVLELACWGVMDIRQLQWLDMPPAAHVNQAKTLLMRLGAMDTEGRVTALGKNMADLGMSPRLAAMVLKADKKHKWLACVLASLIEERDIMMNRSNGSIEARVQLLKEKAAGRRGKRVLDLAARYVQRIGGNKTELHEHQVASLLAMAFPDRIARARDSGNTRRYLLSNGRGAAMHDELPASEFIVVTDIDDRSGDSRIFRYASLTAADMEQLAEQQTEPQEEVEWDEKNQRLSARRVRRLGAVVLESKVLEKIPDARALPMLQEIIASSEMKRLPWTDAVRNLQARMQLAATLETGWPDVSAEALLASLEQWLSPYLAGIRSQAGLDKLDMVKVLKSMLDWKQQQWLQDNLPERYLLPGGRHARIDYTHQPCPLMRGRVQDFFGLRHQPMLAQGRVEVIIELLSPANRPVQRTQDIAGFWSGSYAEVRKEMKGRYPKHSWPEKPENG